MPPGHEVMVDLVGRADELRLIDALLDRHGEARPGLLLRGAPGTGKTALLDAAAARARATGRRVLRAAGTRLEAGIAFSTLHQLLYPLRADAERLDPRHREPLRRLFALAPDLRPEPALITAVLALLSQAGADGTLLVIVDDAQWADPAGAAVLAFAARRVFADPVRFLAAARDAAGTEFDQAGLAERDVGPLAEAPAAALLDARWPDLAPPVRRRLLGEAAGNPLALCELPAALTGRQRRGQDPLPAPLPLSRRLQAAFAAELPELPEPARRLLLLAALEPDAGLATLRRAAKDCGDDLVAAQHAGLARVDHPTGRVSFRHPLARAALVQASSPAQRRAAHRALAAALADDPERRAWHLAELATGPDEAVARALDEAAASAWRRGPSPVTPEAPGRRHGGAPAAVALLMRAAEFSPRPADRSRRLVEAAYLANTTGQLDGVTRLLSDAGQAPESPAGLLFAATAYLLAAGEGEIDAAHRLLAKALDEVGDAVADTGHWDFSGILFALLIVSIYSAEPQRWELLRATLDRFDPAAVTPLRLCYEACADPAGKAGAVRAELSRVFAALPVDAPPWQVIPLAYAAASVDAMSDYRYVLRRMIDREREGGAVVMAIVGLLILCIGAHADGRWDEAESVAREGLDLTAVYGYQLLDGQLRAQLALISAARGDTGHVQALTDEVTAWATPRGVRLTQATAAWARALAALGDGDYEEAYLQARRADPPGTVSPVSPGPRLVLDLVEAAVHTGRTEQARDYAAAAQRAGVARISTRTALLTAGAAAVAAADEDAAGPLFEAALSLPQAGRWPFEQARIHLAYGQWLRRTRDTARARMYLRAAADDFDRLGACPWARRARDELRATGFAAVRLDDRVAGLTAQERRIAELAATGLTNKQIGERLFLSPRTVSGHLHRIFPKLGITSRAALRDALQMITPDRDAHRDPP